jgi:hypothetical protein
MSGVTSPSRVGVTKNPRSPYRVPPEHQPAYRRRQDRGGAHHQHQAGQEPRGGVADEQFTHDRHRDDRRRGAAQALQYAQHAEDGDFRRDHAEHGRHDVQGDTGEQGSPAVDRVRDRADEHLTQR